MKTTQTDSRPSIFKRITRTFSKPDQPTPNERLRRAIEDRIGMPGEGIDLGEVRAALADGADPNMALEDNLKYPTLLVQVALHGDSHLPIIRELVAAGAELHDMPEGHYTPGYDVLGTALMQEQDKAAALLIDLGADVNRHGHFGGFWSSLQNGASAEEVALVRKMFDAGGICDDDIIADARSSEFYNPDFDYRLPDNPTPWEPGGKNLLDLLEEWVAERRAQAMDASLPPAAEQPRARERF